MCKKVLGLFLMGAMFSFYSCVDDTYDLNKEIITDVEIKGNKLALPLGSLRAILLDSLISADSLDLLDQKDGVYNISIADTIAPYEFEMPKIEFDIPEKNAKVEVNDFAKANITEVQIKGKNSESTEFSVPTISLNELKIPKVDTDRSVSAANSQVKTIIEQYGGIDIEKVDPIPFNETFTLDDGIVDFNLSYTLPEQIETLYTIYLKKDDNNETYSEKGALIGFKIIHPIALKDLDKKVDFDIVFPDEFIIDLDPTAVGQYTLDGHTISVKDLEVEAGDTEHTEIRFYIKGLENLADNINNGVLSFNKEIQYQVKYDVNGMLKFSSNTTLDDFNFKVTTDLALTFHDVKGKTKDINVEFEAMDMAFDIDFNNLEHITKIDYVIFAAEESKLNLQVGMDGGFAPFTLKEGYALKLQFPQELTINDEYSEYPKPGVEFVEEKNAFYIRDLEVFNNTGTTDTHWALALEKLELNKPVVNGEFHDSIKAVISVVDSSDEPTDALVLAGTELESMTGALESFDSKEVSFSIEESHFVIKDAVVYTENIVSKLSETIEFSFENNDLPKEIRRIESIGFEDSTPIFIKIKVDGLEDLGALINLDLQVKLPKALDISENNDDSDSISIKGDTLYMHLNIDPSTPEPKVVELTCHGFDFTREEGYKNGLCPEIRNDKGYIEYKSLIDIEGEAVVNGTEFHADILDNGIKFYADFEIDNIEVKDFHGIFYVDDLGGIEESFDFDLGDNLDFLNSEDNTIVLADPQISISVDNAINVPISAHLSLIGKDADGQVIESSIIEGDIKVDAADYNPATGEVTPRTTNLFITAKPTIKEGYTNIAIENLANLLKQIPASIDIMLIPAIDTTNTQHINLIQPLKFGGNYEVTIPLEFNEFNFVYSDTITDLNASLGEMMDMFSNVKLGLNMNIKNSMPLQLLFKAVALDEFNDTIHGITISEFEIPAGDGKAFNDTITGKDVSISISSRNVSDLSTMDKLKFDLHATANSTAGGTVLRGEQGLKLEDISIEVSGDIKLGE